jgi:hypothetical protein
MKNTPTFLVRVSHETKIFFFLYKAGSYRNRVDHCWKIRSRKIRTDVGKFSYVNRTIAEWNRLPEGVTGTSLVKTHVFRKKVRKVNQ